MPEHEKTESYLSLELLLRQLGSLDDVTAVAIFQRLDESSMLDKEGAHLELWDCLLPLQLVKKVYQ